MINIPNNQIIEVRQFLELLKFSLTILCNKDATKLLNIYYT